MHASSKGCKRIDILLAIEFNGIPRMPLDTNHQEFGPCGIIDLLRGMLLVASEGLAQCQLVLKVLHWCEDRGGT
jgi:hypothetical protein